MLYYFPLTSVLIPFSGNFHPEVASQRKLLKTPFSSHDGMKAQQSNLLLSRVDRLYLSEMRL